MLDRITYINHLNEKVVFGEDGIYANYNELRNYEWDYDYENGVISNFRHTIKPKKFPVEIAALSESDGIQKKNRLFEIFEKDVLAEKKGRLVIGDYYYKCYITASKKSNYLFNKNRLSLELTVTSDSQFWIKELSLSFSPLNISDGQQNQSDFLNYAFDYPYDYKNDVTNRVLSNTGIVEMPFRLIIYGPCVNPVIYISSHAYQVNCSVESGEHLIIDSSEKTIQLVSNHGIISNKFAQRNKESYIFQKIPAGSNNITWDGSFGFDITLFEERSEPRWT